MAIYWSSLSNPSSNILLNSLGYWVGILGFLITLGGFAVGLQRLKRVENAANAAKVAVGELKFRISQYDAAVDIMEARHLLTRIRTSVDKSRWREVEESYSKVLELLGRAKSVFDDRDGKFLDEIAKIERAVGKLVSSIDKSLSDPTKALPPDFAVRQSIRAHIIVLENAHRILQERVR